MKFAARVIKQLRRRAHIVLGYNNGWVAGLGKQAVPHHKSIWQEACAATSLCASSLVASRRPQGGLTISACAWVHTGFAECFFSFSFEAPSEEFQSPRLTQLLSRQRAGQSVGIPQLLANLVQDTPGYMKEDSAGQENIFAVEVRELFEIPKTAKVGAPCPKQPD